MNADQQKLAGSLHDRLLDGLYGTYYVHLADGAYKVASEEEAAAAGYDGDGTWLLLCRDSDGVMIEAQVTVSVHPVASAAERAMQAAKIPPGSDWVLRKPCGCPCGVTVAGRPFAVTEDDAWRSFFTTRHEITERAAGGYRVGLMSHDRFAAEVLPALTASQCLHDAGQQELPVAVPGA